MNKEALSIIKGIILVILVSAIAIFVGLKLLKKEYIYTLKYYEQENLYTIKITEDYKAKMEISVICNEDKCQGNYNDVISIYSISSEDAKKLVEIFNLNPYEITETNEDKITEEEELIVKKIIN